MKRCPKPGIYFDIPFEEYRSWIAVNSSILTKIRRESAAHYKADADSDEEKQTRATELGTALHTRILEPLRFAEEYVQGVDPATITRDDGSTYSKPTLSKPYTTRMEELSEGGTKKVLKHADFIVCENVNRDAHQHWFGKKLLADPGPVEITMVWKDPVTGMKCKGRIDKVAETWNAAVDLKSTTSVDPDEFEKAVDKWGYAVQGAHYLTGWEAVRKLKTGHDLPELNHYIALAFEKDGNVQPIETFNFTNDALEWGLSERRDLMAYLKLCMETDEWPAYSDGRVVDMGVPKHARHWQPPPRGIQ